MKTLRIVFSIFIIAFFICNESWSNKPIKTEMIVTISGLDYGPGIGIVSGTYSYLFTIKLDDNGKISSMHWNVGSCNLSNDEGDKVKVIDSAVDTKGIFWDLWNNIGLYNTGYPISFDVQDGWLNDNWPDVLPVEGSYVNMNAKVMCKGSVYNMGGMMQLHMNANGVITANVVRGWLK